MPAMAPMAPGTSRSDPKPVLKASKASFLHLTGSPRFPSSRVNQPLRRRKEWVVPPRPKPGRKSTKSEAEQAKAAGRTSQKAFRERRQEYVTELEEKVRSLEAGEGEKCVFFQQQAQKAKMETAALRTENDGLRKVIEQLRRELDGGKGRGGKDKGKGRAAPVDFDEPALAGPSKRPRRSAAVRAQAVVASASSSSPLPIPPADSPLPALSPPSTVTSTSSAYVHSPLNDFHPVGPASPHVHAGRCGFCPSDSDCFCAQIGYNIAPTPTAAPISLASPVVKIEDPDDLFFSEAAYEPAVPLRLRKTEAKPAPVWAIQSIAPVAAAPSAKPALCNGDPSNCPACSDDPFGKAFCNALSTTVCSTSPCANCPGNCSNRRMPTPPPDVTDEETALFESLTDLPCCGDPALCGSLTCKPAGEASAVGSETTEIEMLPKTVQPGVRTADTVPCNEAWTALKAHPNIAFADLQMLADVVAKRTHCGGPVASTPPPPPSTSAPASDFRPELVPQAQLQCSIDAGTRKRLTVERGAVNEALDILDRAVARGGPLRR
ncbi:hypothetical protein JCM10213v2_002987 [Rhodosporidiobolus nylandii]